MNRVMLHPFAGVLSAYGMGLAEVRSIRERQLELPLEPRSMGSLDLAVAELSDQIRADLAAQDVPQDAVSILPRVNLRYAGTDTSLPIDPDADIDVMVGRFEQTHRQRFGYIAPDRDLVLEAATVEGVGRERDKDTSEPVFGATSPGEAVDTVRMYSDGVWHEALVYHRDQLAVG
ncbi:MAG: 5-oxoprolinase, partial [Actinomycetia bacterium]|nr:5-oxoprolinase [Actinomycetes bacterium]